MSSSHLASRGYLGLIGTQFFGAANDNILKGVLTFGVATGGLWASTLGDGGQAYVALCLTIPFILFSGYAGQLADRLSKRRITVTLKIIEVAVALIALSGFMLGELWTSLVAMVLLAVQSAFFGPAKYGMLPELVEPDELSRANGVINMSTNIAIIVGMLAAGPIYDAYAGGPRLGWLPGAAMVGVAAAGLLVCLVIPRLPARAPELRFDWNPIGTYLEATREMARGPLIIVAIAWSSFYMIGMLAILILPDYKALLGVSATQASLLLGMLGVSIGIGSVLAGVISGHRIEPRLVPIGAFGMTVCFALLGLTPPRFWLVMTLIFGTGLFAGFYIIPLQALLQYLSPETERGRFLGTANAMSFVCSTIGSLLFLVCRDRLGMPSNRVFLICALLSGPGTVWLLWQLRKHLRSQALPKGLCPACGHTLLSGQPVCPECGATRPAAVS